MIAYLGYNYYKSKIFTLRYLEVCLASIFLFLLLLILQSSAFGLGLFGNAVIDFLQPNLGHFGIWILALFGIGVCFISLGNKDIIQIIKEIDFSRKKQKLEILLHSMFSLFYSLLKRFYTRLLSIFKSQPKITHSPLIEITPTPSLSQEQSPVPPKQVQTLIEKQGFTMSENEKIHIQEFIISSKQEYQKGDIRILEGIKPQKQNPFLHNQNVLSPIHPQNISTSAELVQKIKNQDSPQEVVSFSPQTEITQTPQAPQIQESPQEDSVFSNSPSSLSENPSNYTPSEVMLEQIGCQNLSSQFESEPTIDSSPKIQTLMQNKAPQSYSKRLHIKSLEENEALLKEIDQGEILPPKNYELPPISLLAPAPEQSDEIDENEIDAKIESLLEKLSVFKIDGDVIRTYSGPIITTFEFRPAPNVKVSRIQSLENDIAMALEAKSIRIQAPIPGKNVVGIEIPNSKLQTIYLREIFESEIFQSSSSPLTLALGKDVVGKPFITDLKKLPHLLIAGTTGSGKSVGVNAMILSLLYRNSPDDLKLMMVDPKMVEFMPYSDLPHLITPIITDPKKAVIGLTNAVREMERRYSLMSQSRTKEIVSYNQKAKEFGLEPFPYFVIIIDELADLMMTAGKEVEYSMARIAQMGRASGMHLIVATQSPRAEVLTGLIKTNLPAHLSYKVGTKIDAGIIGCSGAETLLGRGDMLFTPPGVSGLVRLHAPWSSEDEVNEIVSYIKTQRETLYDPAFLPEEKEVFGALDPMDLDEETSELLNRAKEIILQDGKTSISYLQRRLSIGYNKAATLIEKLEQIGFLSEADAKGNRQIL